MDPADLNSFRTIGFVPSTTRLLALSRPEKEGGKEKGSEREGGREGEREREGKREGGRGRERGGGRRE